MNKTIESLCEGKYEPLKQYFDASLLVEDLQDLTIDDLTECAESPKHKMLMRVFWAKVIVDILDNPDPFKCSSVEPDDLDNDNEEVLAFHDRIMSSTMTSTDYKIPAWIKRIENLALELKQRPNVEKCKVLDLSRNNLVSKDGKYIVDCASVLPNCTFVDLKINRLSDFFDSTNEWLCDLVVLDHIKYVRITSNALATIECKNFWKFVNTYQHNGRNLLFEKLIWVEEYWLEKSG